MKTAARFCLERIAALDRAVRDGEYPNAGTIARALEVCRRTVQRDVEFLRDRLGAPLAFDARHNGYYYSDPTYRLPGLTLSEGELVAVLLAGRVLEQYRGTPYAADLTRAFRKIALGLSDQVTIDLGHLDRALSFRTTAAADLDPALFRDLAAAIRGRRGVALRYFSASRNAETTRDVDPYHMASVDGDWYLVGRCHTRGDVRMFVPSRIRSLEPTGDTFEVPAGFRIEAYLAGSFAVLRGEEGESHRVRLRFTGEAARYVGERTWHPSQVVERASGSDLVIGLELSHLREVEKWALSWGGECEVLEPPELRDRVARGGAAIAALYEVRTGAIENPSGTDGGPRERTRKPR